MRKVLYIIHTWRTDTNEHSYKKAIGTVYGLGLRVVCCNAALVLGVGRLPVGHNLADDSPSPRMPTPPSWFTRSRCKCAARACASGLRQSRGAERCGRRCRRVAVLEAVRALVGLEKQRLQL
eukprot:5000388-Pleurochrysis_carterae.AAC.1